MMKKRLSKTVWYGSEIDTEGNPVVPRLAEDADDLEGLHHGELYLHEADDNLSLWVRTLTNQVKPIGGLGGGGSLWKLMETESGEKFLFTEFNVVTQKGITSFADNKILDLPGIYDGLPIDNQTLYWEETTNEYGSVTRILKARGGDSSDGGTDSGSLSVKQSGDGNAFTSYTYENGTLTLIKGSTFALQTDYRSLSQTVGTLQSSFSDMIMALHKKLDTSTFDDWKSTNEPKISDGVTAYGWGDHSKAGYVKSSVLSGYVTIDGNETITGEKDFTGGLKVNGSPIVYNSKGYWMLTGDLLVTGGITSYSNEGTYTPSTIMDAVAVDGVTIVKQNGVLAAVGGGTADSVAWGDITGKPGWIDSSKPSYSWVEITSKPSWIGESKPTYSYAEINGTPDLTEYALKTDIPSLSGYATQAWVNNKGYATQSWVTGKGYITSAALDGYAKSEDLEDYLPLTGALPSGTTEFKLQGDLRLQKGTATSGRKLFFGDGLNVYLYESPDNFLNIYAHNGMKIYTQSSKYIELSGKGVKVNNGIIIYNESGGYFELDGNLLVTGGITAFADSGAGNQWILDATALSGVTSTSQYKVYSARVTKLLKDEVDEIVDKIAAIKSSFSGLSSSSSASVIGSALKTLAGKL